MLLFYELATLVILYFNLSECHFLSSLEVSLGLLQIEEGGHAEEEGCIVLTEDISELETTLSSISMQRIDTEIETQSSFFIAVFSNAVELDSSLFIEKCM